MDGRALTFVLAASLLVVGVACRCGPDARGRGRSRRGAATTTGLSRRSRRSRRRRPPTPAVRFDLAIVLQWAARSREATGVFESTRGTEAPEYVLSAMTRAYRDQQRWTEAAALATEGGRRFPGSAEWPLATRLAEAGAALGVGDSFAALRAYLAARQLAPDDTGLQSEVSGLLVKLGCAVCRGPPRRGTRSGNRSPRGRGAGQPGHDDSRPRSRASLRPDRRGARAPRVAAGHRHDGLSARRRPRPPPAERPRGGAPRSRALDGRRGRGDRLAHRRASSGVRQAGGGRRPARAEAPGRGAHRVRGCARRRPAVALRPCGALLRAARGRARERRAGAGRRDGGGGRTEDVAGRVAGACGQLGLARSAGTRRDRPLLRRRQP